MRLGTVKVPDERIDKLSRIFAPKKTIYAQITFCDIPGEHGAEKKGLSRKALQQIREQDAICLVLRDLENPALECDPDPAADLEAFHAERILADLEVVERRVERARKEKLDARGEAAFQLMKITLEQELPLRSIPSGQLNRDSRATASSPTARCSSP